MVWGRTILPQAKSRGGTTGPISGTSDACGGRTDSSRRDLGGYDRRRMVADPGKAHGRAASRTGGNPGRVEPCRCPACTSRGGCRPRRLRQSSSAQAGPAAGARGLQRGVEDRRLVRPDARMRQPEVESPEAQPRGQRDEREKGEREPTRSEGTEVVCGSSRALAAPSRSTPPAVPASASNISRSSTSCATRRSC